MVDWVVNGIQYVLHGVMLDSEIRRRIENYDSLNWTPACYSQSQTRMRGATDNVPTRSIEQAEEAACAKGQYRSLSRCRRCRDVPIDRRVSEALKTQRWGRQYRLCCRLLPWRENGNMIHKRFPGDQAWGSLFMLRVCYWWEILTPFHSHRGLPGGALTTLKKTSQYKAWSAKLGLSTFDF